MKITYTGNHVFVLPKTSGGFVNWTRNTTHSIDDDAWGKFEDKDHIKAMVEKGILVPHGQVQTTRAVPKPTEPKQREPEPEQPTDEFAEFRKLHFTKAIKKLDEMDRGLLHRLYRVEKRKSVLKPLAEKLGKDVPAKD